MFKQQGRNGEGSSPIARAIERLRQDFDRPLRVEQLARELGMSVSGFHQHFKAVTALSPLQFQNMKESGWPRLLRREEVAVPVAVRSSKDRRTAVPLQSTPSP